MRINELAIKGVYEITLSSFEDERGAFIRIFDQINFKEFGLPFNWVQENISINRKKGVLRGLHFILPPYTDGKLIRCSKGKIWDVVVDLRKDVETQGRHIAFELRDDMFKWIYIPKGFAHGFCTLTEYSEVIYKHDTFYKKNSDSGILWSDPELNIDWPVRNPTLSEKDKRLMTYSEFINKYGGL